VQSAERFCRGTVAEKAGGGAEVQGAEQLLRC